MQKILDAIAEFNQLGIERPTRQQVAWMCERSAKAGGYGNDLGHLSNQQEMIFYPEPGTVALTEKGTQQARAPQGAQSLEEFHRKVYSLLEPRFHEILTHLVNIYPDSISREDLAELCNRSPNAGGWGNDLGRLRNTLEMIEYPLQGKVRASELLFPSGLR